jgi:hypothetical protein
VAASPVEHKDVVLAIMGASAALSGLVLVFLGLVVGAYGGLAGDTPSAVRTPLRRTALIILGSFALGVLCLVIAVAWLVDSGSSDVLYAGSVVLFAAQLLALVVASGWTLRELLWD